MPPLSSLELDIEIGQLVNYYLDGQRIGHLEKVKNGNAIIRPIAPYKAGKQRCVTVPTKFVDIVEIKAAPVKA